MNQAVELVEPTNSYQRQVRWAITLSWFTISYNVIEGVVSIFLGISEGSMALAGFGGDSLIEVASASLVLWRFRGDFDVGTKLAIEKEKRATLGIGILFVLLALVTVLAASANLFSKVTPDTTLPGLIVSLVSLSFMFYLWASKKKVAKSLNSSTMAKDASCSLACIKLSFILFAGSLLYMAMPTLWWADSAAALLLSIFIGHKGIETIKATRKKNFVGGCGCS